MIHRGSRRLRGPASLVVCAVALCAAAGASSKPSTPSGSYKGKTSAGLPVSFRISGGKVRGFDTTVHAQCISVVAADTYYDPILNRITPQPMKLGGNGKFQGKYYWPQINATSAKVDGKVTGKTASGHYRISYSKTTGATTSLGVLIIYACSEQGTWTASRR